MPVSDEQTSWEYPWEDYKPSRYDHVKVTGEGKEKRPEWADPEDPMDVEDMWLRVTYSKTPPFAKGGAIDLQTAGIQDDPDLPGAPLNPRGRTGLRGRGLLGKWGPNQAVGKVPRLKSVPSYATTRPRPANHILRGLLRQTPS